MRGPLGEDLNKHAGEITSLGVVDGKIGAVWYDGEGKEVIRTNDIHLGLRQCIERT
jgi:hypothetical protein